MHKWIIVSVQYPDFNLKLKVLDFCVINNICYLYDDYKDRHGAVGVLRFST